jgi:mRNA-degrading endonuclease RelE of RelBE toxin-antitoxin system
VSVTVIETREYERLADLLFTSEERDGIRAFLAECPQAGDVIPHLSGMWKLRWTHEARNKGKRGGTRVIYFYALSDATIVLLYAYSKEQKEDLTDADRKNLKAAVEALKAAFAKRRKDDQVRGRTRKKR